MLNLLSSIGMEESRDVSNKFMISIPLTFMHPSMRDNLVNSLAARPFKFQCQNLKAELLQGPELDWISPDFSKRKFLNVKKLSKK